MCERDSHHNLFSEGVFPVSFSFKCASLSRESREWRVSHTYRDSHSEWRVSHTYRDSHSESRVSLVRGTHIVRLTHIQRLAHIQRLTHIQRLAHHTHMRGTHISRERLSTRSTMERQYKDSISASSLFLRRDSMRVSLLRGTRITMERQWTDSLSGGPQVQDSFFRGTLCCESLPLLRGTRITMERQFRDSLSAASLSLQRHSVL